VHTIRDIAGARVSSLQEAGTAMPGPDLVTITDRFIAAFNAGDWRQLAALLAPGVRYTETGTGRQVAGVEAYIQLCQGWKQTFPDGAGTIRATVAEGETVVQEVLWEGVQESPLPTASGEISASGRRIAVFATLWYTCDREWITTIRHHLDLFTMLQQIGAFEPSQPDERL
jgi:steroid delta-isomerase-like uncharacterized protein